MRTLLILILIIISSCKSKSRSDKDVIFDDYTNSNFSKRDHDTIFYAYRGTFYRLGMDGFKRNEEVQYISSYLSANRNPYGPFFKFNASNKLESYYFMTGDGKHDLYDIIYNTNKNKYDEGGYPDVDYFPPGYINDSGNNYSFIFNTFPRKDLEVLYSLDKTHYNPLQLSKKASIPYLEEADITLTRKQIKDGIVIKVKARNLRLDLTGLDNFRETTHIINFNASCD